MAVYQCWGDDHEDLTDKVEQAIAALPNSGIITFGVRWTGKNADTSPRKVRVTCNKGHQNVFPVED